MRGFVLMLQTVIIIPVVDRSLKSLFEGIQFISDWINPARSAPGFNKELQLVAACK